MRARHESSHFFVANLNVFYFSISSVDRTDDPVDAVTGIRVDAADTPYPILLSVELGKAAVRRVYGVTSSKM